MMDTQLCNPILEVCYMIQWEAELNGTDWTWTRSHEDITGVRRMQSTEKTSVVTERGQDLSP